MDTFQSTVEKVGMAVDAIGVLVIVGGILVATVRSLFFAAPPHLDRFTAYRQNLGRAILLGLELLVAGGHHQNRCRRAHPPKPERARPDRGDPDVSEFFP